MFKKIQNLFKNRGKNHQVSVRDQIRHLISLDEEAPPSLDPHERFLLRNVLELRHTRVNDVMSPQAEMGMIFESATLQDVLHVLKEKPCTRYPVYRESLDHIIGYVHVRDLISDNQQVFDLKPHIKPILFVPPSAYVLELLIRMRTTQTPLAIVVDEFGGVDGLVTAWDVLQNIIGDLYDLQYPTPEDAIALQNDGSYILDGRLDIDTFQEKFGEILSPEEDAEDIETIGGLLMYTLGRVPDRREIISHHSGIHFEVLEATPRSVVCVRMVMPAPLDSSENTPPSCLS